VSYPTTFFEIILRALSWTDSLGELIL
jgi:hypothetical protein